MSTARSATSERIFSAPEARRAGYSAAGHPGPRTEPILRPPASVIIMPRSPPTLEAPAPRGASAMSTGTQDNPLRVAIVGSGPAGFYAAGHLLKPKDRVVQVDMFDRLPTPWGLVRAGVAPDHPNIKAVTRVYERVAQHASFSFFGGLELGQDVLREDLLACYHAVVYAIGAPLDRRLGIPGEDL